VNQPTRESLHFVLREMEARLEKLYADRKQIGQRLTDVENDIAELERRRAAIIDDLDV
jgi:hypothetical protein